MEELNHLEIDVCGKKYTFNGGGGSGSQPAPDSVGTEQIRNKTVKEEDLEDDVAKGLHELDNPEVYATHSDIDEIFDNN